MWASGQSYQPKGPFGATGMTIYDYLPLQKRHVLMQDNEQRDWKLNSQ